MKRRDFITLLGSVTAAFPLGVRAQPILPVIGFLSGATSVGYARLVAAFRRGLSEAGFVEGQNVKIEYRWAEGDYDRLPALVTDLVDRQVSVIVANSPAAVAAKAATTTIPIVFNSGTDPVKLGLVTSLNRPGGNVTGVSNLNQELGPKRLELIHELIPTASTIALLVNPNNPGVETISKSVQTAARALRVKLDVVNASTENELATAFATLVRLQADALVIGSDPYFIARGEQLGALALRNRVPTIFEYREFATGGGLISYGVNPLEPYRLMGLYTGRILKGEKPADLPVQQPTNIELFVNLKAAKMLGITVPPSLLSRADEVIE